MSLQERQVEARRVAAERDWTAALSLAERRRLSDEDWELYRLAFSFYAWDEMPGPAQDGLRDMVERVVAAESLARQYEADQLARGA